MKYPKYIPLPHDEQGFLFRFGDDDLEASIAVGEVSPYAYYYMNELCLFVNTIDIMRKKDLDYFEANQLAFFSNDELPWNNAITPGFAEEYLLNTTQNDHAVSFKNMKAQTFVVAIANSDLARRDELIEQFKKYLYGIVDDVNSEHYDSALFEHYFAYIEYAFDELLAHWADANHQFVAPIFATSSRDPEIFGCESGKIIATAYIPTEDMIHIYNTETNLKIAGLYKNGDCEPFLVKDLLRSYFPEEIQVADFSWERLGGENNDHPLNKEIEIAERSWEELYGDNVDHDLNVDTVLPVDFDEEIEEYL